jgi:hypothetical protein
LLPEIDGDCFIIEKEDTSEYYGMLEASYPSALDSLEEEQGT